jgi:hypothetical protein
MDLSQYKLQSFDEIVAMMAQDRVKYGQFEERIYKMITWMKPGEIFELKHVEPSSRPAFVKIICMAITEGYDIVFSEDYSILKKLEPVPPMPESLKRKLDAAEDTDDSINL